MTLFQTAQREKAKLRLALEGPSGSGKTHSALLLAAGLVPNGKIFLIDTEHSSASLEVGKPSIPIFLHATLESPYTAARYKQYIDAAGKEGANLIIVDSLSHAWSGEGGLLEKHDKVTAARRDKNSWAAWRDVTPDHNALIDSILQCPCHIICTMRTKTAWEVVENERGKKAPVKIGLKPEQREGMDYEFTVVLDLSLEKHIATASKDRTSLFDGKFAIPSIKVGEELATWLSQGIEATQKPVSTPPPTKKGNQEDQANRLIKLMNGDKTAKDLQKRYQDNTQLVASFPENLKEQVYTCYWARKKAIEKRETITPPTNQPDPVSDQPPPQNEEEIPLPAEEDLPPDFSENSIDALAESKEATGAQESPSLEKEFGAENTIDEALRTAKEEKEQKQAKPKVKPKFVEELNKWLDDVKPEMRFACMEKIKEDSFPKLCEADRNKIICHYDELQEAGQ